MGYLPLTSSSEWVRSAKTMTIHETEEFSESPNRGNERDEEEFRNSCVSISDNETTPLPFVGSTKKFCTNENEPTGQTGLNLTA